MRRALVASVGIVLLAVSLLPAAGTGQSVQQTILVGPVLFPGAYATEGEQLNITVNVTNIGPTPKDNVTVNLYWNYALLGSTSVDLGQYGTGSVQFQWTAVRGYNQFIATAMTEDGELAPPYTTYYAVNSSIEIKDISFSPDDPADGETVTVSVTLFNNRSTPLQNLTLMFGRLVLGMSIYGGFEAVIKETFNESGLSLAAMEERTFSAEWRAIYGNQTFIVEVTQRTQWGNDTLASESDYVVVENARLDVGVAALGIVTVLAAVLAAGIAPCVINKLRNGLP